MNWTPDKPINYEGAKITPNVDVMIQSNYWGEYAFWTFSEHRYILDPFTDVALWRVKPLKPKV